MLYRLQEKTKMDESDELNQQYNRSSFWNSFIEPANLKENVLAPGITGLVCFILLMLLLVFEIFYICRYKTTFLQRLFFYLTIAVAIFDATIAVFLGYTAQLTEESCHKLTIALGIIISYSYIAETLTITFINVSLLRTMFKYHFERRSPTSSIKPWHYLNRCCNLKLAEAFTIVTIFAGPLMAVVAGICLPDVWVYFAGLLTDNFTLTFITFFAPGAYYALLLSLFSTLVIITWLLSLRRKGLSKNRMKSVCREVGLLVGILVTWSVLMIMLAVLPFYPGAYHAVFPVVHSCMPFIFLVYICTHATANKAQRKLQLPANSIGRPTVPPSTRVSLPSDTVARALNFLSPSTAEPTDVTPLLKTDAV